VQQPVRLFASWRVGTVKTIDKRLMLDILTCVAVRRPATARRFYGSFLACFLEDLLQQPVDLVTNNTPAGSSDRAVEVGCQSPSDGNSKRDLGVRQLRDPGPAPPGSIARASAAALPDIREP